MIPQNQDFRLYSLLHGDYDYSPLIVGKIPISVSKRLGRSARNVIVTIKDAQKIRHHPQHGMDATRGLALPIVIRNGNYYQSRSRGTVLQIEVILHQPDNPRRAYFLVLARDRADQNIYIRTFFFNAEMPRNKMKDAEKIHIQNTINYFK